jgi:hypothetical protein
VRGLEGTTASAHISILQEGYFDCGVIEIASFNVLNSSQDGTPIYSEPIFLPAGDYKMVVSAAGQTTRVQDLNVGSGESKTEGIIY